jgi:glycosyltransferase 2 family protein
VPSKNHLWSKGKFFLLFGILFYVVLGLSSESSDLISSISQIDVWVYLISFILFLPMFLFQSLRFHIILKKLGIETTIKNSILVHVSSLSMLITPGAAGSLLKSVLLKKKTGNSISSTAPIVFFERWLELTSITIIIGFFLLWYYSIESILVFLIGIIIILISFIIFKKSSGINFINKLLIKTKILKKFTINQNDFIETTNILITSKNIISLLSLSLFSKIFPIFAVFYIFKSFNLDLNILQTSQIYFVGQIIGALTFVPGGILVTEASLLGLMLNSGIEFSIASIIVILIRLLTFWFPILLGFIVLRTLLKNP